MVSPAVPPPPPPPSSHSPPGPQQDVTLARSAATCVGAPAARPAPPATVLPPAVPVAAAVAAPRSLLPAWLLESQSQLASFSSNLSRTQDNLKRLTTALSDFDDSVARSKDTAAGGSGGGSDPASTRVCLLSECPGAVLSVLVSLLPVSDAARLMAVSRSMKAAFGDDAVWHWQATARWHVPTENRPGLGLPDVAGTPRSDSPPPLRLECWVRAVALRHALHDLKVLTSHSSSRFNRSDLRDSLVNLSLLALNAADTDTTALLLEPSTFRAVALMLKDESSAIVQSAAGVLANLLAGSGGQRARTLLRSGAAVASLRSIVASPGSPVQPMAARCACAALCNVFAPEIPVTCVVEQSFRTASFKGRQQRSVGVFGGVAGPGAGPENGSTEPGMDTNAASGMPLSPSCAVATGDAPGVSHWAPMSERIMILHSFYGASAESPANMFFVWCCWWLVGGGCCRSLTVVYFAAFGSPKSTVEVVTSVSDAGVLQGWGTDDGGPFRLHGTVSASERVSRPCVSRSAVLENHRQH